MALPKPDWRKVDKEELGENLSKLTYVDDKNLWTSVRDLVDNLPRAKARNGGCRWWNPDLERMRKDVARLRRRTKKQPRVSEDYCLVRKGYRAMLVRSRYDFIEKTLRTAGDPEIFRLARNIESRRVLLCMIGRNGESVSRHKDVSALIAEQLDPGEEVGWVDSVINMSPVSELGIPMRNSLTNTGAGIDDIGYPMLSAWMNMGDGNMERLVNYGLRHDIRDWHLGEVVLIPKADKPAYNVVKSWRMIHLLPTIAKVVERIMLLRLASQVQLGDTQFGSRRKRGVHDAMAVIYEFLEHNKHMKTAMMLVDVEGGFDKIKLDDLCDFLAGRECDPTLISWIRRWASRRRVRFRFNGRVSKIFHLNKGIPQGSPLSPFLFGIYIADIFTPRLRYGHSLRRIVVSYVDGAAIMVAADSMQGAVNGMIEVFEDCHRIASGRGMGFSAIKTKWIGFGDKKWDGIEVRGHVLEPVDSFRVLGFFFNIYNNFSAHVEYWLRRGIEVRQRIAGMGRQFGERALGAYGTYRLFQVTYLPTVYYGLEFLAGHRPYVKEIERHVNDCLRSLFGCSFMMANNIVLAEYGTVPVAIQGRYLQRKSVSRMVNYRYCDTLPWFGDIRSDWLPGLQPCRMSSLLLIHRPLTVVNDSDKDAAMARWMREKSLWLETDCVLLFSDGSKSVHECGVAWYATKAGRVVGKGSCTVPASWSIVKCEIFATLLGMDGLDYRLNPRVRILLDCKPVLSMIKGMECDGASSGLWEEIGKRVNLFEAVTFQWIPGHKGIEGNETVDGMAKKAVMSRVQADRDWDGMMFGIEHNEEFRRLRRDEWLDWDAMQGHSYYAREPGPPTHLKGLERIDAYILNRLRAGINTDGHDGCPGHAERYHLLICPTYANSRPMRSTLFDDKQVKSWTNWAKEHYYLGMGIPKTHPGLDKAILAGGNPFDRTVWVRDGDVFSLMPTPRNTCKRCDLPLPHGAGKCLRPVMAIPTKYEFIVM